GDPWAWLFGPWRTAVATRDGKRARGRVELVGDVMADVARLFAPRARERLDVLEAHGVAPGEYALATAHRAGTVDDPERLGRLVELLQRVPVPVVAPLHPRTRRRLEEAGLLGDLVREGSGVHVAPPLGYLE